MGLFSTGAIYSSLETFDNLAIDGFSLPIQLRVGYQDVVNANVLPMEKVVKLVIVKLLAIVCCEGVRYAKSGQNMIVEKTLDTSHGDACNSFNLDPLGEVVNVIIINHH